MRGGGGRTCWSRQESKSDFGLEGRALFCPVGEQPRQAHDGAVDKEVMFAQRTVSKGNILHGAVCLPLRNGTLESRGLFRKQNVFFASWRPGPREVSGQRRTEVHLAHVFWCCQGRSGRDVLQAGWPVLVVALRHQIVQCASRCLPCSLVVLNCKMVLLRPPCTLFGRAVGVARA